MVSTASLGAISYMYGVSCQGALNASTGDVLQCDATLRRMFSHFCLISTKFSQAGKKDKNHPDRQLVFHVLDYLREIQSHRHPQVILLENVPRFMKQSEYGVLRNTLSDLGYHFTDTIYDACQFGVPQSRQRVFMVAVKRTASKLPFIFPAEPYTREEASKINLRQIFEDPQHPLSHPLSTLLYGSGGGVAPLTWVPKLQVAFKNLKPTRKLTIPVGWFGKGGDVSTPICSIPVSRSRIFLLKALLSNQMHCFLFFFSLFSACFLHAGPTRHLGTY